LKIAADDLEDLVKIGLVYEVNKEHKFSHQTYGEFGFNKFLDRNFDDEDCAKFIVEVVLVDPSYRIIRAFLNFWILEKLDQKTFEIYQNKLLANSIGSKGETPLHVAGQEGNENIFRFLYSSLASKTQEFENKKKEIENFLLKFLKCSALAIYFQNCTDSFDVLTKIENDFGTDFVRKIFEFGNEDEEIKLLHAISQSGRNVLKVLKFLRETFAEDLNFLGEVFLSRGYGRSFLHVAFENLKNETLSSLLDELNEWKKMIFFNDLILMGSGVDGVFLSKYARSRHFDNDFFSSFLDKLKLLLDGETLKAFFLAVDWGSRTLLHHFCLWTKNFNLLGTLEWINREIGKDFLIDLILKRDRENQTIFHIFTKSKNQPNSTEKLLEILKFFKENLKLENEFLLKEILFSVDRRGVFLDIFSMFQDVDLFFNIFNFLTRDLGISVESLKTYLNEIKGYFPFSISQIEEESRVRIVEFFEEKFQIPFYSDDFYSAEILHEICENNSEYDTKKILNYFNFVEEKISFRFLKKYISRKNSKSQTILVHFHHDYYSGLTEVFEWLKEKISKNFLENFLMQVDENGDSFLHVALRKCGWWTIDGFFTKTFEFLIRNFDKSFVQNCLLIQNKRQENCLNLVCQRREKKIPKILGFLSEDFQNDQEFFTNLLNDELKKNKKVRKWIKKNLDFIDLPEVGSPCSESSQEDSDSSSDRYSNERFRFQFH
jgi:hypothetical protein